ncbi:N-acetylneuraminate synthase family protein [uncultured Desulfovibrio sp.]|uniref:N-acetylneuraminate synthase family protein n=1 Tax=uncultured Desulfovibrio sp. TaxID=167968 RepID=UPI0025880072|nr:N-acetylneuraminate synthase family protein [uncultured Desulfovibrio sp.]
MIFDCTPHPSKRPVSIVFEAGPTHDGLPTAKLLVDMAVQAGADAIKFQIIDAKKIVPSKDTLFTYEVLKNRHTGERETITESLQEILSRRELTFPEWVELIAYCKEKNLLFFATASNAEEMEFLANAGCACVKICSGDINYHHLLRQAARFPWVVQIDTGSATLGEVEQAVDTLETAGCRNLIINHCPSGYPARLESINLRTVQTLRQMFPYPVAFSDHTPGTTMDIAAVALGADMLEKTITLNRCIRSPEHIMSLEPQEAEDFVRTIREVEIALGNPRRIMTPEERAQPSVVRRSVVAARDIIAGETLTQDMLDYARPGDGLPAHLDYLVLGKRSRRAYRQGEKLFPSDVA